MSRKRNKNRADDDNGFAEWGGYMEAKKTKLSEQFDVVSANLKKKSEIFQGVSILVNGYTQPSADELKFLMAEHGGGYHLYQNQKAATTHIIATNLPNVKINQGDTPVVHAKWITDSIEAKKLLDFKKYLLYSNESKTQPKLKFPAISENSNSGNGTERAQYCKTATDPGFLAEFYNNSRLHLISTLGAEFKQLVNELRQKCRGDFPGLTRLTDKSNLDGATSDFDSLSAKQDGSVIMHIDMDCFFVSVGLRKRPHLKGKPVAVTHSKTGQINRNVNIESEIKLRLEKCQNALPKLQNLDNKSSMSEIASCSYEARRCGISNGMLMGAAMKLCPDLIPIPYDFESYKEVSHILYSTIAEYTVDIEAVSCDEMYVDVTKILRESGRTIDQLATHIRNEIISRTGCPCSTGFGSNRLQARMGTKRAKPNGQYYLKPIDVQEYFKEILLKDLPGVGWSTLQKLNNLGLNTCGDIQNVSLSFLKSELGHKNSQLIYEHSQGIDSKPLNFEHERKSVSVDVNYGIRFKNHEESLKFLDRLSNEVFSRLTDTKLKSKCVTLKLLIRAKDAPVETAKYLGCGVCDALSRSTTTNHFLDSSELIFKEAKSLYLKLKVVPEDLRGVGIQLSRLEKCAVPKSSALTKFLNNTNLKKGFPKMPAVEDNKSKPEKKSNGNDLSNYFKAGKKETITNKKKNMTVDLTVLRELPEDIQKEIMEEYDIQLEEKANKNRAQEKLEKPSVEEGNQNRKVKDRQPKRKKSFSDLSSDDLRLLLRNWIMTEPQPKEVDVNMLGEYLKEEAIKREIEKLFPLLRFIYRHINKMTCDWHEAYFKLLEKLQEGMRESFGNPLHVPRKFSCDKHSH